MSKVGRFGASCGAAVVSVLVVTLISHYTMSNAISTTMSRLTDANAASYSAAHLLL